jgi:hypothetical protein
MAFIGKRVVHEFVQKNPGPCERVFPLLCPVREGEWLPGWEYRLLYSHSGVAELGCVFATPNPDGSEKTWVVTHYDSRYFQIHFCWIQPGAVATRIEIALKPEQNDEIRTYIRYTYTGLSEAGNREIENFDEAWFTDRMRGWEKSINHYLRTGEKIAA